MGLTVIVATTRPTTKWRHHPVQDFEVTLTVPHEIGNIGDKISSKESHDAHGNVHELPSEKRLLKVHAMHICLVVSHTSVNSCSKHQN